MSTCIIPDHVKVTYLRLCPFHALTRKHSIQREHNLLQFYLARVTIAHGIPFAFVDANPFSGFKESICRSKYARDGGRHESRLLDCGQDMEIRKCGKNEVNDNSLDRISSRLLRKRSKYCAHLESAKNLTTTSQSKRKRGKRWERKINGCQRGRKSYP